MTRLGVNIDHVATVRQARRAVEPDPVAAAVLAEQAGADGITVHLRGDRRHVSERDVRLLREVVTTRLNIEMAVTDEMLELARQFMPDSVTFVPETPLEVTTEGGLDVVGNVGAIKKAVQSLTDLGIDVSLFIDPSAEQVDASVNSGASMIELNTAKYSLIVPKGLKDWRSDFAQELDVLCEAAEDAAGRGLRVLAGHGLTYRNVAPIAAIPEIEELNIGHNIIARAVMVGMERAVREMLQAMNGAFSLE